MHYIKKLTWLFLSILLCLVACGPSITVGKTWRDPDVTINPDNLKKVLVAAFMSNEASSRNAETELATILKVPAVPAHDYIGKDLKEEDRDKLKERLRADGFDGALIMRLVDVDKDIRYIPGSYSSYPVYYRDFWGYYWNSFTSEATTYSPGYYQTTKSYSLEMNVFSLQEDKLVWTGLTTYVDPSSSTKLIDGSAKTMRKAMVKQGFIRD